MAERKLVIEREGRSSGPSVPIKGEKPHMEREKDDYIPEEAYVKDEEPKKKPRPEVNSKVRERVGLKEDTFWSKTKRAMFGDPDEHLAERVWLEQVIPGAKALLFDSFFNGLEYFFFGESSGRRYSNRSAREAGYTGMYRRERSRDRDDRSRDRRDREEVGEIWENLSRPLSLSEAKSILEEMRDIADRSEYVQLDELLKMLGFSKDEIEWTDAGRCWYYEDLRSDRAGYVAIRGGYKLDLPRPRATPGFEGRYRR